MRTLILKPEVDNREKNKKVCSRIGLEAEAFSFSCDEDLLELCRRHHQTETLHCILVDEAQFLTRYQVVQLGDLVDKLVIPVLCYGLRTDFRGELFEGSRFLLGWADELREIKTVCHCGKKAIMTMRLGADGRALSEGEQIQIGGNESYASMCRKHFKSRIARNQV